jgi:hypothetical protein
LVAGLGAFSLHRVEGSPVLVDELGVDLSGGQSCPRLAPAGLSLGFVGSSRVGATLEDTILTLHSQGPRFAGREVDSAKLAPRERIMLLSAHAGGRLSRPGLRKVGGRVGSLGALAGTGRAHALAGSPVDLPIAKAREGVQQILGGPHRAGKYSARPHA